MRRVVVTGLGMVSPLGIGVAQTWQKLIAGQSGISALPSTLKSSIKIAGQVPFDPSVYFSKSEIKRLSRFIQFAIVAADEALKDANWTSLKDEQKDWTGVCIGSGIGSIEDVIESNGILQTSGERRISPYLVPRLLVNLAAGHVSMKHGLRGPNHSVSTACATGAHSIGDAARFIQFGDADVMVAGGSESSINPLSIAGFASLRALSTRETPDGASRPFDQDRDGFVMGEGAGMVVLEEYEHAKRRGAKIYAELAGYGLSGDAYHITSPPPDGNGAKRAMKKAIQQSGLDESEIDYVNAHATSTPVGDLIEAQTISDICGGNVAVSSTKGSIGHLLGAAGAVESIFTIISVSSNIIPPTLNLTNVDPLMPALEFIKTVGSDKSEIGRRCGQGVGVKIAITNSFGFGGTNASLLFKKVEANKV